MWFFRYTFQIIIFLFLRKSKKRKIQKAKTGMNKNIFRHMKRSLELKSKQNDSILDIVENSAHSTSTMLSSRGMSERQNIYLLLRKPLLKSIKNIME